MFFARVSQTKKASAAWSLSGSDPTARFSTKKQETEQVLFTHLPQAVTLTLLKFHIIPMGLMTKVTSRPMKAALKLLVNTGLPAEFGMPHASQWLSEVRLFCAEGQRFSVDIMQRLCPTFDRRLTGGPRSGNFTRTWSVSTLHHQESVLMMTKHQNLSTGGNVFS